MGYIDYLSNVNNIYNKKNYLELYLKYFFIVVE